MSFSQFQEATNYFLSRITPLRFYFSNMIEARHDLEPTAAVTATKYGQLQQRHDHHRHQRRRNSSMSTIVSCPFHVLSTHLEGYHYTKREKAEFALFLKILMRCLEKSGQTFLMQQTRLTVLTCVRGCKIGDPTFCPLIGSIELRLKKLVGERIWEQAKDYTNYFLERQHHAQQQIHHAGRCRPTSPAMFAHYTTHI